MPGARRRVFYFLDVLSFEVEIRKPEEVSRNRDALTGSGILLFDNRKAGKFTVRALCDLLKVCLRKRAYKRGKTENYCVRLQVLLELSITVEEKADLPIV